MRVVTLALALALTGCNALPAKETMLDSADSVTSGFSGAAKGAAAGFLIGCWVAAGPGCLIAGAGGAIVGAAMGMEAGVQEVADRRTFARAAPPKP